MEVGVVKIWRKNKMIEGMKFSLPLRVACWIFRHVFWLIFASWFARILEGFLAGFLAC